MQEIIKELEINMSTKEKLSFRKLAHPQNAEEGQGWEKTEVNDTLNIYDNSETRTPTLVTQKVYDWHRQDTRMTELGDICVTAAAGWGGAAETICRMCWSR